MHGSAFHRSLLKHECFRPQRAARIWEPPPTAQVGSSVCIAVLDGESVLLLDPRTSRCHLAQFCRKFSVLQFWTRRRTRPPWAPASHPVWVES
ncbi:hypothetical protein HETIRDRAFT_438677 [Heterobasidion irregulare TC 32-1]|uniref:Uncharacterized protein n=1 Tax=Heterobasidion irregulare (strain TC 32-1) TaxID=747525 RepID=W4KKB9_HETIT|nr:uncharacterized protein HETIRDRAFT_438677 [Heterobasidion irregulare TC 32-1]ETW86272.1 hypothetical protein HETIRDRAFT_438677 [Heterobasidion irregulare TC 32-1]